MRTHSQIVHEATDASEIAARCNVSIHTVRSWIQRDSIPAALWSDFARYGWATLAELAEGAKQRKAAA